MKNSYILLRKNEESGPFEFEDLQKMGLRPGDMIWVEGQSVAWLSPSEISELRSLPVQDPPAKIPEEDQPGYHEEFASANHVFSSNGKQKKEKSIFVSLPGQKKRDEDNNDSGSVFVAATKPSDNVDPEVSGIKKNEHFIVSNGHPNIKKGPAKFLGLSLKDAVIFILLPLAGAFGGIALKEITTKKDSSGGATLPPATTDLSQNNPEENQNNGFFGASNDNAERDSMTIEEIAAGQDKSNSNSTATIKPKKPDNSNKLKSKEEAKGDETDDSALTKNGIRESKTREEENKPEIISAEKIASLVSVSSNDYKTGAFGGIKDLQLTVNNDSKYILNKVVVEIQYLKPNEETVKTETIQFKSVPPNGSQTIAISKSNRGVKISYRIIKIEPGSTTNTAGL